MFETKEKARSENKTVNQDMGLGFGLEFRVEDSRVSLCVLSLLTCMSCVI